MYKDYNTHEIICHAVQNMIDRSVMQKSIAYPSGWVVGLFGAVLAGAVLKFGLLAAQAVPFNADEAIVALMARHILQGERPLFFYGQAYMGSLDAFLVAGVFRVVGYQVWGIRLVQVMLYAGTLLTTGWLGKLISGKWQIGVVAAWLLAIPTVSMSLYTTVSMGGYGEMLLIGNLILLLTIQIEKDNRDEAPRHMHLKWLGLGFLAGFGLWVFGLTLAYSLPAMVFLALMSARDKWTAGRSWKQVRIGKRSVDKGLFWFFARRWGFLILGVIIGALPWLAFALQQGVGDLLKELGGGAIAGIESLSYGEQVVRHAINLSLFGSTVILGLRPSWEIRWLGLPLAPLVLTFWVLVAAYAVKKTSREWRGQVEAGDYSYAPLLSGVILTLLAGFILTPFGADPSGRYFLPVSVILALYASQAVWEWQKKWGSVVGIVVFLVVLFNLWGTFQAASLSPPGLTTQFDVVTQIDHEYDRELINFLQAEGEITGYTNYWVAYPLAFLSMEEIIFIPRLPYHPDLRYTSRDDRYEPYQHTVAQAEKPAYITSNNPLLDTQLRTGFTRLGVDWQEQVIGDYRVYYSLSERVTPEQIGLGEDQG